jgi:hypothetical protein
MLLLAANKASQPPIADGKQTSHSDPYESGLPGQSGYLPVTRFGHKELRRKQLKAIYVDQAEVSDLQVGNDRQGQEGELEEGLR